MMLAQETIDKVTETVDGLGETFVNLSAEDYLEAMDYLADEIDEEIKRVEALIPVK